ncbi:MAG: GDSL-type esterase/lipase family protein [Bacteroidales bacterium]|nr:GDSL-type esterase/lipase family protein [Bacteroidales bacterium]
MKQTVLLLMSLLFALPLAARDTIRVACVGNSVTYGTGLSDRDHESYPVRLQEMLGDGYDVRNFGHSGATLLNNGHNPYTKLPEYRQAIDFKADLVVIHLGLNDTDPRNWPQHADEFIPDYRALIDSFRVANPEAKIWICLMTPIFPGHHRYESGTRDWHALIQERIRQIAATADVGLIDLYTPLHKFPNYFPDNLHPTAEGALILARTVYGALTGDFGGLSMPVTYGNGMVLQREQPIRIGGIANAGERVTVKFLGDKLTATADADGRWSVTFPAHAAGGPYKLSVKAKSGSFEYSDVWLGEVWLCSGQSNMEFQLSRATTADEDLAAADAQERIHLYNMPALVRTDAIEWSVPQLDSVNRLLYILPGQWERCNKAAASNFSAIAYHFGRILADSLGCHVGLISNAVGGSGTEDWIDRTTLEYQLPAILRNWTSSDYIMDWSRDRGKFNSKLSTARIQRHPYEPAYLFESGILPLENYTLRGVLWYQGESNAHNVELHERLFTMLESSWRNFFGQPDLPFYTVQLSSIATRPSWPHFRDSQRRLAETLPNTWMTVSSDLGHRTDVHPRQKRKVAERLAQSALCHTYNYNVVPSGPQYTGFVSEGSALRLSFRYADGLRAAEGTALKGFEVAGADGLYHPATATISGDAIVVSSPDVKTPLAVRYGWSAYTDANLVNGAGFPASTFRDERF